MARLALFLSLLSMSASGAVIIHFVENNGGQIKKSVGIVKSWVLTDGFIQLEYAPDIIFADGFQK